MSAADRNQGDRLFTEPPPENIPLAYAVTTESTQVDRFLKAAAWFMLVYGVWQAVGQWLYFAILYDLPPNAYPGQSEQLALLVLQGLQGASIAVTSALALRRRPAALRWLIVTAGLAVVITAVTTWRAYHRSEFMTNSPSAAWYATPPIQLLSIFLYAWQPLIPAVACVLLARSRLLRGYLGVA